jgi:hemerythrin-like metal-binding protein
MRTIRDAAAHVDTATNRISELSVENNDQISALLSQLEGKTVVADPQAYRRLYDTHNELHETVARIIACIERDRTDGGCSDIESEIESLLPVSRTIVEMLTGCQTGSFVRRTPAIAVEVGTFDTHHKKLFALIDRLYQAMQAGAAKDVLTEVFDDLLECTGYHFGAEEAAFTHFGYPQCAQHQETHRDLVAKATALRRQLDEDKPMVAVGVMEFLRDWITNHIKGCDTLYSSFLRDKNVARFFAERTLAGHTDSVAPAP